MPSLAATSKAKRLLSKSSNGEEDEKTRKTQRLRISDRVDYMSLGLGEDSYYFSELDDLSAFDHDESVDFLLSIGEDDDIDSSIFAACPEDSSDDEPISSSPKVRSTSVHAEYNHLLNEELDISPLCGINKDAVSQKTCINISADTCYDIPLPLLTPPSSPRRVLTVLNGITEETTICEWPCNLTVDNAITSALELAPLCDEDFKKGKEEQQ